MGGMLVCVGSMGVMWVDGKSDALVASKQVWDGRKSLRRGKHGSCAAARKRERGKDRHLHCPSMDMGCETDQDHHTIALWCATRFKSMYMLH